VRNVGLRQNTKSVFEPATVLTLQSLKGRLDWDFVDICYLMKVAASQPANMMNSGELSGWKL
jgi:hypothetical protein